MTRGAVTQLTLRARLGIAAGAAVALAVIAVAVSAYAGTRAELRNQLDAQLQTLSQQFQHQVNAGAPPGFAFPAGGPGAGAPPGALAMLFGKSGLPGARGTAMAKTATGKASSGGSKTQTQSTDCDTGSGFDIGPGQGAAPGLRAIIFPSGRPCQIRGTNEASTTNLPVARRARQLAEHGGRQYYTDVSVAGVGSFRMLVLPLPGGGAVELALSLQNVNDALSNELLLLGVIAAAGIALAALLGFLVARTALAPIQRFTRQAEQIAAHPERVEHERLEIEGKDELARLGRTFNTTLDALGDSITAQRNLVADASHELRTPIATLRANLQLMRDEALLTQEDRDALRSDMIEELDELTKLVGDVVELARGTKPSAASGEVRLDLIVDAAIDRARRRAVGHTFTADLETTVVNGEGARIERAVTNLLDNAAKYAPSGTTVDVVLRDGELSVRDHGAGFHDEDLPFVFDRFHRAKDARAKPGSGLGLAIVRQAAEAHGGFVEASNAPGGGALLRIGFGPVLESVE